MQRSMNILPFPHVMVFFGICTSVCPGAGHLSSFFLPGVGHCHAFSARPWGIVHLKKKKVQIPRGVPGGWAMLELTDALHDNVLPGTILFSQVTICKDYNIISFRFVWKSGTECLHA